MSRFECQEIRPMRYTNLIFEEEMGLYTFSTHRWIWRSGSFGGQHWRSRLYQYLPLEKKGMWLVPEGITQKKISSRAREFYGRFGPFESKMKFNKKCIESRLNKCKNSLWISKVNKDLSRRVKTSSGMILIFYIETTSQFQTKLTFLRMEKLNKINF